MATSIDAAPKMDKSVSKTKGLPWSKLGIHRVPEEDEDKIADLICENCQVDRSLLMKPFWRLTQPDEASASYFSSLGVNRYLVSISHHGVYQPPTYYIPTNELNKAILAWHKKKLPSVGRSKRQEANDETSMDESTAYEMAPEENAGLAIAEIPRADGSRNSRFRFMEPVILDNSSAVEELARDDEAGFQSIEFIETILLDSSETTFLPIPTTVQNLRPLLPKPSIGTDGLSLPIPLPAVGQGTQVEQENRPTYTFLHHLPGIANTNSQAGPTFTQAPPTWPQLRPTLPRIDALNAIGPRETISTSTHPIEPTNAPTFMTNGSHAYPFAPAPPTVANGPTEAEKAKEFAPNFGHRPPNPGDHQTAFYQPPGTRAIAPRAVNPPSAQTVESKLAPSSIRPTRKDEKKRANPQPLVSPTTSSFYPPSTTKSQKNSTTPGTARSSPPPPHTIINPLFPNNKQQQHIRPQKQQQQQQQQE
ncbi:hypothetical protein XANCAGTX0491_009542 [Xanthoria calcicola]